MSQVTSLEYASAFAVSPSAADQVRRSSRVFVWLFTALGVATAALAVTMALAMLLYPGPHLQVTPHAFELTEHDTVLPGARIIGTLPWTTKWAYAFTALARTLPALMILWNLQALFRLYASGIVFAQTNAATLRRIGLWLVAAAVTPFACHLALSASGQEIDRTWFHVQEVQELVLGGLVLVIAGVMQVGREIEEDRSQFV